MNLSSARRSLGAREAGGARSLARTRRRRRLGAPRCSIPYVHVADARAAFEQALREGTEEMMPPERVMEGVTVAIVRAPGGVPVGLSGP